MPPKLRQRRRSRSTKRRSEKNLRAMPKPRHQGPKRMVRSEKKNQQDQEEDHRHAPRRLGRSKRNDKRIHLHRGADARDPRSHHMRHEMPRLQTEAQGQAPRDDGPRVAEAAGVDTDVDAGVDTKVAEVAEGGTATGAAEEEKGASLGNRAEQLLERCRRA